MKHRDRTDELCAVIVAFRASEELLEAIDEVAAADGLSRADVARRAALRDLKRRKHALATNKFIRDQYEELAPLQQHTREP